MASKTVLLNALFDQFISFTNEMHDMYPDDPDFSIFATTLKMLKMTNPSILPKYIVENTKQFKDKIDKKDVNFFLDYSFSEYQQDVDLNIFSKLKQYVASMKDESKECVWKYVHNIIKLSNALI